MGLTGTTSEEQGLTIAHLYQKVCYTGLTGTTSEAPGLTIAHLYQRVCYMGLTGTTSEERGLTIAHLYQRVCYSCGNLPVIPPRFLPTAGRRMSLTVWIVFHTPFGSCWVMDGW